MQENVRILISIPAAEPREAVPLDMDSHVDPDDYQTTDADWERAHAFRDGLYLGPALEVRANHWNPVVPPADQHLTFDEVIARAEVRARQVEAPAD